MKKTDRIFIAGASGLLGSAVKRRLEVMGYSSLLTPSHSDLDLTDASVVENFFKSMKPQFVVLAAGKVGGIIENSKYPAEFMVSNMGIQLNVIQSAARHGVERLMMYGSSCMYPREYDGPMGENLLMSDYPEPTSIAYAIAKLAGIHMCLAYNRQLGKSKFIPVIPNSVYGPNDNFESGTGHVLSGLMDRFHKASISSAEEVVIWGTGTPRREFIHADDVADASVYLLMADLCGTEFPINIGVGSDHAIGDLAHYIADIVGFKGRIICDANKPDGAPRKLLDSGRLNSLGWSPKIGLLQGLKMTYEWYLAHGK